MFEQTTPITVVEILAVGLNKKPAWLPIKKSFKEKVKAALSEVKLEYALDRKIGHLSGGELQSVLLALALMPTPDILLLDEPISGVDVSGQQMFYEIVYGLKERFHMGIVLITHDFDHLEAICDRAILLNKTILADGDAEMIKEKAKEVMAWKRSMNG